MSWAWSSVGSTTSVLNWALKWSLLMINLSLRFQVIPSNDRNTRNQAGTSCGKLASGLWGFYLTNSTEFVKTRGSAMLSSIGLRLSEDQYNLKTLHSCWNAEMSCSCLNLRHFCCEFAHKVRHFLDQICLWGQISSCASLQAIISIMFVSKFLLYCILSQKI